MVIFNLTSCFNLSVVSAKDISKAIIQLVPLEHNPNLNVTIKKSHTNYIMTSLNKSVSQFKLDR